MIYCTIGLEMSIYTIFLHKSLLFQTMQFNMEFKDMELKDIMKQRRAKLEITQQDLAELAQVGLATVKDIERGKGNPSISTVKKILEVLGMKIDYRIRKYSTTSSTSAFTP